VAVPYCGLRLVDSVGQDALGSRQRTLIRFNESELQLLLTAAPLSAASVVLRLLQVRPAAACRGRCAAY
jgi:hypothetical protein